MSVQRNEVTQYVADIVSKTLRETNFNGVIADDIGGCIADKLSSTFGGQVINMPVLDSQAYSMITDEVYASQMKGMAELRRNLLIFLAETTKAHLKGISDKALDMKRITTKICSEFCHEFAGQNLVIPKDLKFKTFQRNQKIFKEFNGRNHAALAMRYEISVNALYRVLKKSNQKN